MKAKRSILRIQLDRGGKEDLARICEQRGMTQISLMSRLVQWFVRQDEAIQLLVLGLLSRELAGPLARRLLEQLSNGVPAPKSAATEKAARRR